MAIVRTVRITKSKGKRRVLKGKKTIESVYVVSFETHAGDRVKRKTEPSSLGFYHFYPEDMSDEQAKEILKQHLLTCCQNDLKVVQDSIVALEKL